MVHFWNFPGRTEENN